MRRFFLVVLVAFSISAESQIIVTFKDGTYQTIDKVYNDDFPTPTHCFSFGAGGLWHARFYFEHYTQSNSVLHANVAGGARVGETRFNSLFANIDFIQSFEPLKIDRNVRIVTKQAYGKIYVAAVPTKVNVKVGLRGSVVYSFYGEKFEYRGQRMYGTNSIHAGIGFNITIARYTHLILKERETGAARETRLFFIPTYPVLMRFDAGDAGLTRMKMKTVNEYYGYPSNWGWRAGIEYKQFTAFHLKNYLIGINAYLIVEKNHYYAVGTGEKPAVYNNSTTSRPRLPHSIVAGLGYSFMKKATRFDDIHL